MMRHLKVLSLVFLVSWYGCQYLPWGKKEYKPIFVGESEPIIVEPPEDAFDVSYRWSILDLPDESLLVPDFSSQLNLFTFTPDVVGDYAFAVTVVSYGEEIADYSYYFRAIEDTSLVPREEPIPTAAIAPAETPAAAAPVTPSTEPVPAREVASTQPETMTYQSDVVPGHFTVQVSSWKTANQAQKVLQMVMDQTGYDAYIQRIWLEDRNEVWWRVRIGDYTSVNEARELQQELVAIYPGAWVDNVRMEVIDP